MDDKVKKKILSCSILAALAATSMQAHAFKFKTPDDWNIRWDNTLKGNIMSRVAKQDADIYDPTKSKPNATAAAIADDATYSVDRSGGGLVSTRIDLLSELDVVWKEMFGFRVSGAGWYDFAYDDSDHPEKGPTEGFPSAYSTWGALSVHPGDYTDDAEDLHYRGGELLDAFVFANFDIGDVAANVRVGRHTIYWGQSILPNAAVNGFAGSMAAIDLAKGLGTPGIEAKELFMPNGKVSSVVQLTNNLTLNGFYAFEFVPVRWAESGTYFSFTELTTENSEFLTVVPGTGGEWGVDSPRAGFKVVDDKSKDSGDWGINLQYYVDAWNLETSFIYMNNTDRMPNGLYATFGGTTEKEDALARETNALLLGHYGWVYKDDIDTFGISLSKEIFDVSWGADLVYRKNQGLSPELGASLAAPVVPGTVNPGNSPGATADTMHVVLNGLGLLNGDWGLWDGGRYVIEATFSKVDSFGDFEEKANANIHEDRWNSHIAAVFKPTWYQVRSGWDLSLPMSVSYQIDGDQAPSSGGGTGEVGNGSLGVELLINEMWIIKAAYNVYYGPQGNGSAAYIKDRDNVALTLKRTF
jgi:hypothetical protein